MKVFIAKQWLLVILTVLILGCSKKNVNGSTTTEIPVHPLRNEQDLDILLQQIGDSRIVLLGEASHGTAEYYEWRAAISKRLIQEKGFNIIAVEGDWSESYRVNQFIKGGAKDSIQAVALLKQYTRWPTWMWGNYEIASLVTWLNAFNQKRGVAGKVGFYGLDVYGPWESINDLGIYIQGNDSLSQIYNQVRNCFQPYRMDMQQYGFAATGSSSCRGQAERLWQAVLNYTGGSTSHDETHFVMQQNALGILNAEKYYRTSVSTFGESWNIRDRHMAQTMTRLLDHHGSNSKIIVWEHNTHVGDARYTDMAAEGMVNIGQLAREQYGEDNVYIIGFGSNSGSVIAADAWASSMRSMNVPKAKNGSWEHMLHQISPDDKIILSSELWQIETLKKPIGHRAIGVVYNPANERGNYVPSIIPNRYDAFIYIDKTKALRPIK